jgi:hypothetical protein
VAVKSASEVSGFVSLHVLHNVRYVSYHCECSEVLRSTVCKKGGEVSFRAFFSPN